MNYSGLNELTAAMYRGDASRSQFFLVRYPETCCYLPGAAPGTTHNGRTLDSAHPPAPGSSDPAIRVALAAPALPSIATRHPTPTASEALPPSAPVLSLRPCPHLPPAPCSAAESHPIHV